MTALLESHFDEKDPVVRSLFERLLIESRKFGVVKVEPKKTSIHLVSRFAFAGVYTRRNYINLELPLARKVASPRVEKVEKTSANRYHHRFKLESVKDLDKELLGWLREAYDLKR